jgi:phosphopentomutase
MIMKTLIAAVFFLAMISLGAGCAPQSATVQNANANTSAAKAEKAEKAKTPSKASAGELNVSKDELDKLKKEIQGTSFDDLSAIKK